MHKHLSSLFYYLVSSKLLLFLMACQHVKILSCSGKRDSLSTVFPFLPAAAFPSL
jgi:hypothetical protein